MRSEQIRIEVINSLETILQAERCPKHLIVRTYVLNIKNQGKIVTKPQTRISASAFRVSFPLLTPNFAARKGLAIGSTISPPTISPPTVSNGSPDEQQGRLAGICQSNRWLTLLVWRRGLSLVSFLPIHMIFANSNVACFVVERFHTDFP